ncbi:unnamed protein product [Symbiodinium sp. CCMP2592]|nr:unnamed protein product [Symbiodinium sp. CCMP2592]
MAEKGNEGRRRRAMRFGFGLEPVSEVLFPSAAALGSLCLQGPGPQSSQSRCPATRPHGRLALQAELSAGLRGDDASEKSRSREAGGRAEVTAEVPKEENFAQERRAAWGGRVGIARVGADEADGFQEATAESKLSARIPGEFQSLSFLLLLVGGTKQSPASQRVLWR